MEHDINLLVNQIDDMVAFELKYYFKRIGTMDAHSMMYASKCGRLDAWYQFAYAIVDCDCIQDAIDYIYDDIREYATKTRNSAYHRGYVSESKRIIDRLSDFESSYMCNADEPIRHIYSVIGLNSFNINM